MRRSLRLPASAATFDAAWDEVRAIEADVRGEATGSKVRGDPVAIAAKAYLTRPRERLLAPSSIRIVKDIVAAFGPRRLNDVTETEWRGFVDNRQAGNTSRTRERYLGTVCAFLRFAAEFHRLAVAIRFDRDKEARNPRRRKRRRVNELRAELIRRLLERRYGHTINVSSTAELTK